MRRRCFVWRGACGIFLQSTQETFSVGKCVQKGLQLSSTAVLGNVPLEIVAVCITSPALLALIRLIASVCSNVSLQTVLFRKGMLAPIKNALERFLPVTRTKKRDMSAERKRHPSLSSWSAYFVCRFMCRLMLNNRWVLVLHPGTRHRYILFSLIHGSPPCTSPAGALTGTGLRASHNTIDRCACASSQRFWGGWGWGW